MQRKVENNKHKLIIVDDEAFNLLALKGMMRVLGMEDFEDKVELCYNG